jgi:hypothetical protein
MITSDELIVVCLSVGKNAAFGKEHEKVYRIGIHVTLDPNGGPSSTGLVREGADREPVG